MSDLAMPLTVGTRVGPYEVVEAIGAGGMGVVFRARDHALARDVAVKVLPPAFIDDDDRRQLARRLCLVGTRATTVWQRARDHLGERSGDEPN